MTAEPSPISEREREILRLVAMGATNQQIAHQLNISINTVKVHLRNIFGKIGAASRTEATVYAIQQGLVTIERQSSVGHDTLPEAVATAVAPPPPEIVAASADPAIELLQASSEPLAPSDTGALAAERAEAAAPEAMLQPANKPRRLAMLPLILGVLLLAVLALVGYLVFQNRPEPVTTVPTAEQSRWRPRGVLPKPRSDFGAVTYDGKIYVLGGQAAGGVSASVERYDPASNTWSSLGDKPTPATHVQAALVRGLIYVPGGEGADGKTLTVFEAYDPRNQRWQTLAPLPEPRSRYAVASVEGRLYLFGGWDGSRYRAEVFVYDPGNDTWSTGAPLPTPRRNAGAAAFEGRIYVMGGENESGALRLNERYDPNGNQGAQWTNVTPLELAVATPAISSVASNIWVFDPATRATLQYNPAADAWKSIEIPASVSGSSRAVAFNNTSVFLFGQASDGTSTLSEYQAIYNLFLPNTGSNS
jgi:DNA-binding CsgD family transcriptional regulator/N-acetylneuraminic acid mutarotase